MLNQPDCLLPGCSCCSERTELPSRPEELERQGRGHARKHAGRREWKEVEQIAAARAHTNTVDPGELDPVSRRGYAPQEHWQSGRASTKDRVSHPHRATTTPTPTHAHLVKHLSRRPNVADALSAHSSLVGVRPMLRPSQLPHPPLSHTPPFVKSKQHRGIQGCIDIDIGHVPVGVVIEYQVSAHGRLIHLGELINRLWGNHNWLRRCCKHCLLPGWRHYPPACELHAVQMDGKRTSTTKINTSYRSQQDAR
jgi:hypothetical protein